MNSLEKIETKPLNVCLAELKEEGFIKEFTINENGLHEINSGRYYKPEEYKVNDFFKAKSEGNDSEYPIVFAIETSDGIKGILSNALKEKNDVTIIYS